MAQDEQQQSDRAAVRFPPPLVYVVAMGIAVVLQSIGWGYEFALSRTIRIILSSALIVSGLGLVTVSLGLFRRTGQQPEPWTSTPEIITAGIYGYTRNPMYLGMGVIQAGIGIALQNAWVIALVLPALWIVYLIAIRQEEAYLARKFGDPYLAYKKRVRRWI